MNIVHILGVLGADSPDLLRPIRPFGVVDPAREKAAVRAMRRFRLALAKDVLTEERLGDFVAILAQTFPLPDDDARLACLMRRRARSRDELSGATSQLTSALQACCPGFETDDLEGRLMSVLLDRV